ncbi:MAG: hypothetical protein L3J30_11390 [Marinosulfonomonas sp.]|nr:hypothetical protein [Marinosulfonomonas sp.]
MLDHWGKIATQDIIDLVEAKASSAKDRLRLLAHISTSANNDEYGGALAEAAIRDWARYDENAAKALKSIDQKRIAFVTAQFRSHGTPKCQQNANILYAALIGLAHLSHHGLATPSDDLPALLDRLLDA